MKNILLIALLVISNIAIAQKNITTQPVQKRLALVIGNKNYEYASKLINPVKDAKSIAETLKNFNFEVMLYTDLNLGAFKYAVNAFAEKAPDYDILLFYYAGHGMLYGTENYLIPTDASLMNNEKQIDIECLNIKSVLGNFNNGEGKANIAIIDACRNRPFNRSWMTKKRDLQPTGLALPSVSGSIIANAAGEGETASDNIESENGLYTSAFLKYMKTTGLSIIEVFQLTRKEVKEKSGNKQNPVEANELIGNFYFDQSPEEPQSKSKNKLSKKQKQIPVQQDTDGDGIVDSKDDCPFEKGEIINRGCPLKQAEETAVKKLIDSDDDGIIDSKDKCPFEKGEMENGGCPVKKIEGNKKQKIVKSNEEADKPGKQTFVSTKNASAKNIKLMEGTSVRLILKEELSSKTAQVGDPVELEILENIVVNGYVLIKEGTSVKAEVTECSKAKALGKQGKIDFTVTFVASIDGQNIRLRSNRKVEGKSTTVETIAAGYFMPIFLLSKGKEAKITKGTKFNGYVDNNYTITSDEIE